MIGTGIIDRIAAMQGVEGSSKDLYRYDKCNRGHRDKQINCNKYLQYMCSSSKVVALARFSEQRVVALWRSAFVVR